LQKINKYRTLQCNAVAKQNLLVVDADPRSLRVLEVSLRKAGYSVAACSDAAGAFEMMELSQPDLILSDTRLPDMDGFAFVEEIRKREDWANVPFMFLSSDVSVESKVRGLELGVEDYLTKPIYIKEIITRVTLVLQRKKREGMGTRELSEKARFSGSLGDMGLVDLLQSIDIGKKSGVLYITSGKQRGAIYFRDGALVDAELGSKLRGDKAVYRAMVWSDGGFEIDFRPVRRQDIIKTSTQGILMEGMRRMDEWGRMLEQLPPLESVFEVNEKELLERLAEIPDEINGVLRYFDGKNSLMGVVEYATGDDIDILAAISKLYFEGIIVDTGLKASVTPPPIEEESAEPNIENDIRLSEKPAAALRAGVVPGRDDLPLPGLGVQDKPRLDGTGDVRKRLEKERHPTELAGTLDYPPLRNTPDRLSAESVTNKAVKKEERPLGSSQTKLAQQQKTTKAADDTIVEFSRREETQPVEPEKTEAKKKPAKEASQPAERQSQSEGSVTKQPGEQLSAEEDEDAEEEARKGGASVFDRETVSPPKKRPRRRRKRLRIATSTGMVSAASIPPEVIAALQARTQPGISWVPPQPAPKFDEAPAPAPSRAKNEVKPRDEKALEPAKKPSREPQRPEPLAEKKAEIPKNERVTRAGEQEVAKPVTVVRPVTMPKTEPGPFDQKTFATKTTVRPGEVTATLPPAKAAEVKAAMPPAKAAETTSTVPPARTTLLEENDEPQIPFTAGSRFLKRAAIGIAVLGVLGLGAHQAYLQLASTKPNKGKASSAEKTPAKKTQPAKAEPQSTKPVAVTENKAPDNQPQKAPDKNTEAEKKEPVAVVQGAGEKSQGAQAVPPENAAPEKGKEESGKEGAPTEEKQKAYEDLMEQATKLEKSRHRGDAVKLYEKAIDLNPAGKEALSKMAFYYLGEGKNKEAAEYAERAVVLDPSSSEAWIVLGAAKGALKDRAGSQEAYQKCAEVGAGSYVRECKRMLR
jgi:CheY-like chemotaxis protein